jgi:hypothetical protein
LARPFGEPFILEYGFPDHIRQKLKREAPEVEWDPVEVGLREWLVCCAYRRRRPLGMPSRAVDYAWHAFILDTAAYRDFCDRAYGRFLDHFPADADDGQAPSSYETVWAWDRSRSAARGEATLWSLDAQLDLEDPWGLGEADLAAARTTRPSSAGNADWLVYRGGCAGGDAGAGGCGGGGGCGGCGGGGCGGGGG